MPDQSQTMPTVEFDIKNKRLALQSILERILGTKNVYFQPPYNLKLSYPCIIYNRMGARQIKADNRTYNFLTQYEVDYVTMDPDEFIFKDLASALTYCTFNRHYVLDRLHHNVYTVYI